MAEIGKMYKHYKGNYYFVVGYALHTETGEDLVIYRGLEYKEDDFWSYVGTPYARPAKMFDEEVEVEGSFVPRFEKVDKLPVPEE